MTLPNLAYPAKVRQLLKLASLASLAVLAAVLTALALSPDLGLKLVWSLIIPAAPLVFFLIPNVWVSVCPFAILQSLPRRFDFSREKRLTHDQTDYLRTLGWALLFILVPARHLLFNHNATALLLTTLALAAVVFVCGLAFKGLSAWCMGFCPIRPVEMMYGQFTHEKHRPEICTICDSCNDDCSRLNVRDRVLLEANNARFKYLVFSFPGFVVGYYLAAQATGALAVYATVFGLSLASLVLFYIIDRLWPGLKTRNKAILVALTVYYYFAVPAVVKTWAMPSVTVPVLYGVVYLVIGVSLLKLRQAARKEAVSPR